jgi:hypothetical protein
MQGLALTLRIVAPLFYVVAGLHLVFGLHADALLGAAVSAATEAEPSLSSQNRFYGVAFALFGFVLQVCARDLRIHAALFKGAMWIFFAAGAARLLAWYQYSAPAPKIIVLLVIELVTPFFLLVWHHKASIEVRRD